MQATASTCIPGKDSTSAFLLWPRGTQYLEIVAAGQGLDGLACLDQAVAAYVAAGGARSGATRCVLDMIASLSMEEGDWLWGPAQALRDRQSWTDHQADLFGPQAERVPSC